MVLKSRLFQRLLADAICLNGYWLSAISRQRNYECVATSKLMCIEVASPARSYKKIRTAQVASPARSYEKEDKRNISIFLLIADCQLLIPI